MNLDGNRSRAFHVLEISLLSHLSLLLLSHWYHVTSGLSASVSYSVGCGQQVVLLVVDWGLAGTGLILVAIHLTKSKSPALSGLVLRRVLKAMPANELAFLGL